MRAQEVAFAKVSIAIVPHTELGVSTRKRRCRLRKAAGLAKALKEHFGNIFRFG
jgi:hypothetical protein